MRCTYTPEPAVHQAKQKVTPAGLDQTGTGAGAAIFLCSFFWNRFSHTLPPAHVWL